MAWSGHAQVEPDTSRYFVYFKNKSGATYPYTLANPQEFLTQRSLDRRAKQGIEIDSADLPVHQEYIEGLRNENVRVFFSSRWFNGALIQAHKNQVELIKGMSFVDSVRLIAKDSRLKKSPQSSVAPTSFFPAPFKRGDTDVQLMMLGADLMHADNVKGQGMMIAVLDNGFTGVDQYSPFQYAWENDHIVATKDFVENSGNVFQFGSHGTSVFSIIGAHYLTDSTDYYGIAYEADFVLCVTEDDEGENTIEEYNWLLGAEFADSLGVDVINSSLGYRLFDIAEHNYGYEDLNGNTAIISMAAKLASDKGMLIVTSAGNDGDKNGWKYVAPPADAEGILTVGSVNADFSRSAFSSIGPTVDGRIKPDVAAFGAATAVVRGSGGISRGNGTSFAAPLIAGFAACIWQLNPERTRHEVMRTIKQSGHQSDAPDSYLGYGVPSYLYAKDVKALNINDILADKVTVYPNPFKGDTLNLLTEGDFKQGMTIKILDPRGSLVFNKTFKPSEISSKMDLSIDSSVEGVYFLFLQIGKEQKIIKIINF